MLKEPLNHDPFRNLEKYEFKITMDSFVMKWKRMVRYIPPGRVGGPKTTDRCCAFVFAKRGSNAHRTVAEGTSRLGTTTLRDPEWLNLSAETVRTFMQESRIDL